MRRFQKLIRGAAAAGVCAGLAVWAERRLVAGPHYQGPPSDHFDGHTFRNHASGWQSEGSFIKWMLTRQRGAWRKWTEDPQGPRPSGRVADGRLRVTFVNHSTVLVQMDGVNILTDPIWSDRTSPVSFAGPRRHRPPGILFEDLPPIDAVLVSHNHYDHLALPTLRRIRLRDRPPILTPLGNTALMARHGVDGGRDLDWWERVSVAGVTVTCVPAQHFSARGLSDRDAALWGGFVISGPSGNVYFAGDTGWGPHFAEIGRRFSPMRAALLPIGAYRPQWFMHPAHISPEEAVEAHRVLGAGTSVAIHFGTFALGDDGEDEPVRDLQRALGAGGGGNFLVLAFGEGREIPPCIVQSE